MASFQPHMPLEEALTKGYTYGRLLLASKVPLLVKTIGTTTTSENVAEAWGHDWNGEMPTF